MQDVLRSKLHSYLVDNNPDVLLDLETETNVRNYLNAKLHTIKDLLEALLREDRPVMVIEELCMDALTADLRPSKFHYVEGVMQEEFENDYEQRLEDGTLTYDISLLVTACKEVFESYEFNETTMDDRYLRYAVIAKISEYLND